MSRYVLTHAKQVHPAFAAAVFLAPAADELSLDVLCAKLASATGLATTFRFFDPNWHYAAIGTARTKFLSACGDWNQHTQDSAALTSVANARK